jgi:hypothetical protein
VVSQLLISFVAVDEAHGYRMQDTFSDIE